MSPRLPVLKVAVVGHTNTGKTSLMRTLMRDAGFGEVSDRPGTTRHVEKSVLLVNDTPAIELFDTPGLEDSIALLEHLESLRSDRREDWVDVIRAFLDTPEGRGRFEQEAKALRQLLASDVGLYVVDARDRVLGKHRDELEILGRCARPIVPVLNFIASPDARPELWRQHLTRVNMHAVAEFDTVVLNAISEQRLFEKMQTLLEPFRGTLQALIDERHGQRRDLLRAAAELVADLLIDVAAYTLTVSEIDDPLAAMERVKQTVREREQSCAESLLAVFRFGADDYEADAVPLQELQRGHDLFSPESLRQFGVRASGGAAAGGLAGLAIDAVTGGLSLGAATVLGATIGAIWSGLESHGRRLVDVFRGYTQLRVKEETLRLLALRQLDLVNALLARGHASQLKIHLRAQVDEQRTAWATGRLPDVLLDARLHPSWSRLAAADVFIGPHDPARTAACSQLRQIIETALIAPQPASR